MNVADLQGMIAALQAVSVTSLGTTDFDYAC